MTHPDLGQSTTDLVEARNRLRLRCWFPIPNPNLAMKQSIEDQIMSSNRIYQPISGAEFRVVHLLPGRFDDEVRCVLETRSCEIKTRYEAISYQWGDHSITKPIRIAHLDSPSHLASTASPRGLKGAFHVSREMAKRYESPIRLVAWLLGARFVWRVYSLLPFDPPGWLPWVSRDTYIWIWSAISGFLL